MASSKLAIINLALDIIGDTPLQSLTDDRLAQEVANRCYDVAIGTALSRAPWRFATVKRDLSRLVDTPLNEWSHAYQVPAECRRLERVYPDQPYEIYGDKLYCNGSALSADFVACLPGIEGLMPDHFALYAAHELAVLICSPLTGSDDKMQKAEGQRVSALGASMAVDAQQRPNRIFRHSPFLAARLGGR